MINNIIQFALGNRLLVIVASGLLVAFGSIVATNMDVDVFPDLTAPTVVVLTEAHGMAPEEVERQVTFQVETAVNGATHVRRVRSSSSAGISIVWIEFDWGTDIFKARQIVNEKITSVADQLPDGTGRPTLAPQASIMGEIMLISLTADSLPTMELRTIADWTVRPLLLAMGGVAQVSVIGGAYKQYQILASAQKMRAFGVTFPELLAACEGVNGNSAGGFLNAYGNEYIIRGIARTSSLAELGEAVIKVLPQGAVTLDDVATLRIGAAPKIGDGSLNGQPAVILTVLKQPSTNTLQLTEKIDVAIGELAKTLPPGVQINTRIFRQADFINASIANIRRTIFEGGLFVVLVLFLFLANWRATVISLMAIPVSLIVAVITLRWLGYSINTMSLGGMAIAIGVLVDDAIIDVENVFKRLKQNALRPPEDRKSIPGVVFDASVEIRTSIINATLIIIVAFLPLFFLSGMEGRLLAPLGISFIVSLCASLIVSITLTPVMASYLLGGDRMLRRQHRESWLVRQLQAIYDRLLRQLMNARRGVIFAAIGLLIAALLALSQLGRSFLPEFNEGSLVITAITLPGTALEESNTLGRRIEKELLTIPEIRLVTRRTGRAELDEHSQGVNAAELDAPFELTGRRRKEFLADVRARLAAIPGANITIGQPIGHRIDHMLSGTRANIAIKLFGPDLARLYALSTQIRDRISSIPGLVDVNVEPQIEIPQLQVRANRQMLARYGIPVSRFNDFVDVAFAGKVVSEIHDGNKRFDLVVRYDDENRDGIENIRNTLMDTGDGRKIPLYMVADIVSTSGPNTINRENVERKTVVSANVAGLDQRTAVEAIRTAIASDITLPEGYRVDYGGQFEAEEKATSVLLLASLLSLLLIFLLLFQEFKDLRTTAIILLNLPLALIGGVFSLWVTADVLSIPAIIGFITLFGVATRNGILLVSRYSALREEGKDIRQIVIEGSVDRLSPILMTALTAGLALIPLAISGDLPGNEIQSPMAKVILGGLLSSTLLNLFVVPVVYLLANQNKNHHVAD